MARSHAILAVAVGLCVAAVLSACAGSLDPLPEPSESGSAPAATNPSLNPRRVGPAPADDAERAYVGAARADDVISTGIPGATDTQLLVAGWTACALIGNGTPAGRLKVIEDEPADGEGGYPLSASIATVAATTLCPQG